MLVVIDTLRADHVGAYGYPLPTTPFLDSLALRGVLFENALSSSSHTAPSHASMFTSLYPESHGVLRNGAPLRADGVTTLAASLRAAGYTTVLFPSVNFLSAIAPGFDHVEEWVWEGEPDYRRATATVDLAIDWLAVNGDEPALFVVVHLYDTHDHGPQSTPPPNQMTRIRNAMRDNGQPLGRHLELARPTSSRKSVAMRRHLLRYDAQLAHIDAELQRFHAAFDDQRGLADSLWIVTSDHGEGLGNHGLIGHGAHLYNEQLRVPLIFHRPSWPEAGMRIAQLVRLIDLYPTLLELTGASGSGIQQTLEGVSVAPLLSSPEATVPIEYVYAQRRPVDALRAERWTPGLVIAAQSREEKYIYHATGPDEYYDLSRDPHELENLAGQRPRQAESLRRWLLETYERTRAERPEGAGEVLPEHLEELEALGYLD